MKMRVCLIFIFYIIGMSFSAGQNLILGAEKDNFYIELLKGKKIGVVVNQTSQVHGKHLVDFLLSKNIDVVRIFTPEHGFRGTASAGEHVANSKDKKSGIEIASLYGNNRKPTNEQMSGLDIVVFDIQDVGVRFYTYISTLHYVMEACAENEVKMLILDRPNPNGDYVDGPVLREGFKSFVGMHPIPVVHGMTIGEIAKMINGEYWLEDSLRCKVVVVRIENYHHQASYSLPINPSPNLPNDLAIRLYPTLCLFEGTMMSVGRGTDFPFQVTGYPNSSFGSFFFTPEDKPGAENPVLEGEICYGKDFRKLSKPPKFTLDYLIEFYNKSGQNPDFFNSYIDKLAGNDELRLQIEAGLSEEEIRVSWIEELNNFKKIRKKYLLYPDSNNN